MQNSLQNIVKETIDRYHMLRRDDRVIIGVSGGADSMDLLHVLMMLNNIYKVHFRVVHVHHGIRGAEADRDAEFVKKACKKYEVPCKIVNVKVPEFSQQYHLSTEEAARYLRYQALDKEAAHWEQQEDTYRPVKIAVAHNKEDNVETILMQLCRGSGLKGVAGMKPIRGRIIRPLLYVSRSEIEEYALKEELSYVTDSTNLDDDYTRNRIRHEILPRLISDVNRGAVDNIIRAATMVGQADVYLAETASKILDAHSKEGAYGVGIPINLLKKQDSIIRTYVIRLMIGRVNKSMKNIVSKHIDDIAELIYMQTGKSIDLPYKLTAIREYDMLWIRKKHSQTQHIAEESMTDGEDMAEYVLKFSAFAYDKSVKIPDGNFVKWFDYDSIEGPMEVRTRRSGDYLTLRGVGRKSLRSYMTDMKIPAAERDRVNIIAVGSHVMWVVGYRISEDYKVTGKTKTVMQIRYVSERKE